MSVIIWSHKLDTFKLPYLTLSQTNESNKQMSESQLNTSVKSGLKKLHKKKKVHVCK